MITWPYTIWSQPVFQNSFSSSYSILMGLLKLSHLCGCAHILLPFWNTGSSWLHPIPIQDQLWFCFFHETLLGKVTGRIFPPLNSYYPSSKYLLNDFLECLMNDSSWGAKHMLWYYIFKLYWELEGSEIFSPSPLGQGEMKSRKVIYSTYKKITEKQNLSNDS